MSSYLVLKLLPKLLSYILMHCLYMNQSRYVDGASWLLQELMPSKEAENSEGAARAGTAQLKSWISGLGKKSKDAETLKVRTARTNGPFITSP